MVQKNSECKLIWRGDIAIKQIDKNSYTKLDALGYDIVAQIKDFISQQGTGKMYKTGKTAWHQASAPGFPPVVWGGQLKISISHVVGTEGNKVFLYIGTTLMYGVYLEVGTKNMQARPWFRIILVKLKPDTINYLISDWRLA